MASKPMEKPFDLGRAMRASVYRREFGGPRRFAGGGRGSRVWRRRFCFSRGTRGRWESACCRRAGRGGRGGWWRCRTSLQAFDVVGRKEGAHLGDGDFVQLEQALRLGQTLADEHGVEAFEIGEDDELLQRRVVADVALGVGMGIAPLLRGLAEESDVEQVGFVGIDEGCLSLGDSGREERLLDGVGVDAVVDLGEGALEVPTELEAVVFVVLEPLEFLDQVNLEFSTDPHAKFKRDVLVGISAAVASRRGPQADGAGFFHPLLDAEFVAVQARLAFNCGEFAVIKSRVVDAFPDAQKLHRVPISQPVRNEKVAVLGFQHVGQRQVIVFMRPHDGDLDAFDLDFAAGFHGGGFSFEPFGPSQDDSFFGRQKNPSGPPHF